VTQVDAKTIAAKAAKAEKRFDKIFKTKKTDVSVKDKGINSYFAARFYNRI
jgi:hypothetical protein